MAPLRTHRQDRLLSIRDLAKKAGVSPQTIQGVESGKHPPRPSTMRKIAEALGIEAREIDEFRDAIADWIKGDSQS